MTSITHKARAIRITDMETSALTAASPQNDRDDTELEDDIDLDEENNEVASEDISPDDDPEDAIIDKPFIARDEDEEA